MQSRTIQRALPKRVPLTKVLTPAQTRTMSFHPHAFFSSPSQHSSSFTPLFRLLDDFDSYSRHAPRRQSARTPTFTPKFDIKELPAHFELHGELAGINQRDITIEFTDPQTLSIRGRSERSSTAGTPPAAVEAEKATPTASEDGAATPKSDHQPTVEDEDAPATTVAAPEAVQEKPQQPKEPEERLWVSERSVGSFARAFTFPGRVEQDGVTASMKDGILSVVVPKAKKHESRRIEIL